jgi:KUP system potassium uptake protein
VVGGGAVLITIDLLFFSANLIKLFHGAWMPLIVGAAVFTVMMTWKRGVEIVSVRRASLEGNLRDFIDQINRRYPPLPRTHGTAVFLDRDPQAAPLAMRALVKHMHTLHEHVILLTLETASVPHMKPGDLLTFNNLGHGDGIVQITATFGFMDEPDVPKVMRAISDTGELDFKVSSYHATYFLSQIELRRGDGPGMARWRKALFVACSHLATDSADYFRLPSDRAIVLGSKLEI